MGDSLYLNLFFSLTGALVTPEAVLLNQRRRLYQELHQVVEMQAQTNPQNELPLLLLLETVVVHIEADIRWLEICIQRIAELKQYQPVPRFHNLVDDRNKIEKRCIMITHTENLVKHFGVGCAVASAICTRRVPTSMKKNT
ncbi:MAG: hypothetical protein KME04_04395 [Pleurocapsa minor GSE-CHR-MK-17-07R]|jgi:hypothetical protein|nr:hypothetical protein [Pleurocapsa minor GSE-CHR-MK 17-07R]